MVCSIIPPQFGLETSGEKKKKKKEKEKSSVLGGTPGDPATRGMWFLRCLPRYLPLLLITTAVFQMIGGIYLSITHHHD